MEKLLGEVENENTQLRDLLKDKEDENQRLFEKISFLEKALDKEKKFHRKFADEVAATEAIRIADFKKEKKSYVEEVKALRKRTAQLTKDVAFYKMAHEELAKNETATTSSSPKKKINSNV